MTNAAATIAVLLAALSCSCVRRDGAASATPPPYGYGYGYPQPQPQPPPPPPNGASSPNLDMLARYNVDRVNAYRARAGLPPLTYDANLTVFAYNGSVRLSRDHVAHANFAENARRAAGFGRASAENQGDPNGVFAMDADPSRNGMKQIDVMLKMMMDEGPGGGHYDNMMSARYRRIGVGLFYAGGRLYMTNDFSD